MGFISVNSLNSEVSIVNFKNEILKKINKAYFRPRVIESISARFCIKSSLDSRSVGDFSYKQDRNPSPSG